MLASGSSKRFHHRLSTPAARLWAAVMTLCLSACVAACSGMAASADVSQGYAAALYACKHLVY